MRLAGQWENRQGSNHDLCQSGLSLTPLLCPLPTLQALEPQAGFAVASSLLDGLGLLPTTLPPFGSLTAAFLLSPDAPSGPDHAVLPAKLAPSALAVEYSVDSRQQCGVAVAALGPVGAAGRGGSPMAATAAAAAGAPVGLQQTPAAEALDLLCSSNVGPTPGKAAAAGGGSDGNSPTATAGGEEAGGSRQHCCFRHRMTLEMPALDSNTSGEFRWNRCWRLHCSAPVVQLPWVSPHCTLPAPSASPPV